MEETAHVPNKKRKRPDDAQGKTDMSGERDETLNAETTFVADKHVMLVVEGDMLFEEPRVIKVSRAAIADFDRTHSAPFMDVLAHVCKCSKKGMDNDALHLVHFLLKDLLKVYIYPTMSLQDYVLNKEWALCNGVAVVSLESTPEGGVWIGDGTEHVVSLDISDGWAFDVRKGDSTYTWTPETAKVESSFALELTAPPDVVCGKLVFADNLRVNGVLLVDEQP